MSIAVEEYLRKLEKTNLDRRMFNGENFMLYIDSEKYDLQPFPGFSKNQVEWVKLPSYGLSLFLKRYFADQKSTKEYISNEIVFSRLYNALGVNALIYYPIILSRWAENNTYGKDVAIASQNLNTIDGLYCEPFSSDSNFYRYIRANNLNIEKMLANQEDYLENCKDVEKARSLLANFIKTGMLDTICMMVDNHIGNKNIVRYRSKRNAEDVISFDLEDSHIDYLFNTSDLETFDAMLKHSKKLLQGVIITDKNSITYMEYLNFMKRMLEEDKLPAECVELIENIKNLNFDDVIRESETSTGFMVPDYKKDFYKKLIDVNQEFFVK